MPAGASSLSTAWTEPSQSPGAQFHRYKEFLPGINPLLFISDLTASNSNRRTRGKFFIRKSSFPGHSLKAVILCSPRERGNACEHQTHPLLPWVFESQGQAFPENAWRLCPGTFPIPGTAWPSRLTRTLPAAEGGRRRVQSNIDHRSQRPSPMPRRGTSGRLGAPRAQTGRGRTWT